MRESRLRKDVCPMQVHKLHLTMAPLRKTAFLLCLLAPLFASSCSLPWGSTTQVTACGTVTSTEALSTDASKAMKAGMCFLQAYQKCQAATLIYIDQDRVLQKTAQKAPVFLSGG